MTRPSAQLDCESAIRLVWDYLDGERPAAELAQLDEHFTSCAHCRGMLEFERAFKTALRLARQAEHDQSKLATRIRAALHHEGFIPPR